MKPPVEIVCAHCPATTPSITVAKVAGWKRFKNGVLRWFECPMCVKTQVMASCTVEIELGGAMTHDEAVYELERVRSFVGSASNFMSAIVEVLNKEYQGARIQVGRRRDAPPKSKRVGEGVGRRR